MDVLTSFIIVIISQYTHVSNYQIVNLNLQLLLLLLLLLLLVVVVVVVFCLLGGSQARGPIGAAAARPTPQPRL